MRVTPRSTRNVSSRPSRSQARFAFIVLFAINVLNYADRYVLPAILPKVRQDLGLTTIEEGLLGSSFLLVYGLTTLPLAAWADRSVRRNIIGLCVGVWSVATTLGGVSRNFWQLISVRTVLGIGKGFWTAAKKILQVPTYLAVIGGLVFRFFTIGGTSFWLPTYLVNTFSLTVGQAGIITGTVLVGSGLVGTLAGGWLADYVQH